MTDPDTAPINLMPPAPDPQPLGVAISRRDQQPLTNSITVALTIAGILPGADSGSAFVSEAQADQPGGFASKSALDNAVAAAAAALSGTDATVATKLDDAPSDGGYYVRHNGAWVKLTGTIIAGLPP